jgi:hypothetical protein
MAALPPLQYHITRMGPDPEREKLNRILEDARKRFSTLDGDITFLKAQVVALTGVNGVVTSVNGQQGDVTISIASLGGVPITRTISSGQGLTGGGNLSADRTLSAKISTDPGNTITFGTDDGLFSAGGGGGGSTGALSAAVINASDLQVGDGWQQFLPADVGPWTGWELVMSPAGGTVQVDILANGTPVTTGGSKPEITTGTSATGSTAGWAASGASAGDMLRVEVTVVTGTVEHVYLYLHP